MDLAALGVLAVLLFAFAVRVVAETLNLRALGAEVPASLAGLYDPKRYRRAQDYTRARTRLGLIASGVQATALVAFWFAGGFPWLDTALRALAWPAVPTGLAFVGALAGASAALAVPFRVISTFVIEERFGFNTTTVRTFLLDAGKGLLLSVALGGPLLAGVLWIFETAGPAAWLGVWGFVTLTSLALQVVAPTWILPLFRRYEPLEEGALRSAITDYAERVGFPLDGVFVIDGSRRSRKGNAFFTGMGKRKRIALFDTLIEEHPTEELVAVLAHEIGHYKKRHILKSLVLSVAHTGLVLFLLSWALESAWLYRAFFVQEASVYAGLVFFGLLFAPIDLVLSTAARAYARKNEYEADAYAADSGLAAPLAAGLRRLSAASLSNLTPHPLHVALYASHPPLRERLAALEGA